MTNIALFRGKPTNPIDLDALPEYHKWVKDGWIYGYLIGKDVIVGEIVNFEDDYFNTEFWCKVKPETVGQYTGLKDENGKGIYEGDIIKSKRNVSYDAYKRGEFKIYVGYVKYIAGSGRYILTDIRGRDVDVLNRTHFSEVIGNVFEDGGLLNDSK